MEYRLLGPLEVVDGGRELPLGSPLRRALLAILLTRPNKVVSVDRLADLLWNGSPPAAAANVIQGHVSDLRKVLGRETITTAMDGYAISVEPSLLDLRTFEVLLEDGSRALADGAVAAAAEQLHDALDLWRGRPLADIADLPALRPEVNRLEELRLLAIERRVEAELALGRDAELVGELEALVAEHPLRERPLGQLMLALYRSGRQVEALEAFRRARGMLREAFGLEPGPALQRLERAILRHDSTLQAQSPPSPSQSILAVTLGDETHALEAVAEPLVQRRSRELILVAILARSEDLSRATARLNERREALVARGVAARTAAFRSAQPAEAAVRLAGEHDADLLLLGGSPDFLEERIWEAALLDAPCSVGVLVARENAASGPVLVPFAGAEHDWAAIEVGAWVAASRGVPLVLAGPERKDEDASHLLAGAALAVQRVVGVGCEAKVVPPGSEGVLSAAQTAALVVVGLPDRWRQKGLGDVRRALAEHARPPVLLVRRGLRPTGLAPTASLTRFTWSLGPA